MARVSRCEKMQLRGIGVRETSETNCRNLRLLEEKLEGCGKVNWLPKRKQIDKRGGKLLFSAGCHAS